MLDESEFEEIKQAFSSFDERREAIIKESRDILKLSKQAIYAVHRDDHQRAEHLLHEAEAVKRRLEPSIVHDPALRTGGFCNAMEEYAEARCLLEFVKHGRVTRLKELGIEPEEYLLGLADLTGELTRRAVLAATRRDAREVRRIHDALERIYGQFVTFDFRNGELRRKYDSIKYNLQKVEQVLYDLTLKGRAETVSEPAPPSSPAP